MKLSWKKESIRVQWLVSYLALLLLPFLFGILIYIFSMKMLEKKVGEVWSQSMERVEAVLEGNLDTIGKMGNSLLSSSEAKTLFLCQGESYDRNQRVSLSHLKEAISNALIANDMIDELYVYFPQTGHVLNNESVFFAEDAGMFHYWFRNSKEGLFADLDKKLYQGVHLVKRGRVERLLYTTCTAPTASLEEQEAILFVYLSVPKLRGLLLAEGLQTVLLQDGSYLSYGESLLEPEKWLSGQFGGLPEDGQRWSHCREDGNYVWKLQMGQYALAIAQAIPEKLYLSDMHRVAWMLAGYVLICIVAGVLLVAYFLKRNYAPVKELLNLTRKMNRKREGEAEFVQIRKLVEMLLERYYEGQQETVEQASVKKSICFYRLLHGKNKYSSISEEDWLEIEKNVPGSRYQKDILPDTWIKPHLISKYALPIGLCTL